MKASTVAEWDGKLLTTAGGWAAVLDSVPHGKVQVDVTAVAKRRSNQYNAYYWTVVVKEAHQCFENLTGEKWTRDEAHEALKSRFAKKEIIDFSTGEVIATITKGSSKMGGLEFDEYVETCRKWLMEFFGAYVPLPNEKTE